MVVDFKLSQGLKGGQNILEELLVKEILPKKRHVIYIHVLQVNTVTRPIMDAASNQKMSFELSDCQIRCIQLKSDQTERLLNKPYVNEGILRGQKLHLEWC